MSFIPGTENRFFANIAPKAAHGRNYKKLHRSRATFDKDMKMINQQQQDPIYAKNLHASLALRENYLRDQRSMNVRNEIDRMTGILDRHRNNTLFDGRAIEARKEYLETRLTELKPQPLAGPEGLYMY